MGFTEIPNRQLDAFFSGLSCVVSVPFCTACPPLLFWSGHGKLARQMTHLMPFCDYLGNCLKDVVSAPRPHCPPVRRVTTTKDEIENAMQYGLPSYHTLNTVWLAGLVDIISGLAFGLAVLAFWLNVHEYIDDFEVSREKHYFVLGHVFLLVAVCLPNTRASKLQVSHTSFTGVALGILARSVVLDQHSHLKRWLAWTGI